jgi:uncharacterized protein (TIGR03437 family)
VSRYDSSVNQIAFNPIVAGPPDDQVFLVLFGRGIQPRDDAGASVRIGGLNAPIQFRGQIANEPEGFTGLDRIVVPVPREMAGRGVVDVEMTVGGKKANRFQVSFK